MDTGRRLFAMLGALTLALTGACQRTTSLGAAGQRPDPDAAVDMDADAALDADAAVNADAALDGDAAMDVTPEDKCRATGGTVQTGICCSSVSDFPGMCSGLIGLCGCPPTASHMISLCECPSSTCFDSTQGCVPDADAGTPTAEALCTTTGGTVTTASCCAGGAASFPDTCAVGACGCGPASSRTITTCDCPGGCFSSSLGCTKP
jgi:hypothetical protein